nr:Alkyl hydroperoxide reductase subunit F [Candidatus Pantoea persica]
MLAARLLRLDGVAGTAFALGGIFSYNVMLGIQVATVLLGPQALPSVALVLVFNSLILWTLLTLSVVWAKQGSVSLQGIGGTLLGVAKSPLIIGILSGTAWSVLKQPLPTIAAEPLRMLGTIAAQLSLVTLGMSLAHYRMRDGLRESYTIRLLKLFLQPMTVCAIAWLVRLPPPESRVVVLLGSMAVGVNVYLISLEVQRADRPGGGQHAVFNAVCGGHYAAVDAADDAGGLLKNRPGTAVPGRFSAGLVRIR